MNGLNKAYFIGHLGRDPEPRTTKSDKTVVSVTLATPHGRKEGETWVDNPDWHRLTAFGKTADNLLRNAHKGDAMAVECVIRPSRWTDKEGHTRYEVNLYIERVLWIAQKRRSTGEVAMAPRTAAAAPSAAVVDANAEMEMEMEAQAEAGAALERGGAGGALRRFNADGEEIPF